ncbi:hypothetical protein MKW92_020186 [Papaver armeniacum]|nr:hypothetical protein MKW92_020186 [Papaver armeniacum]
MLAQFNKRSDATKKLSVLFPEELQDLVCSKVCDLLVIFLVHLHLVTIYLVGNTIFLSSSSWCLAKIPGQRGLIFFLKSWSPFLRNRQYQREAINALPLYPNEQIMWDANLVPCMNYHGEGCLALPKLNLQFLTLHDYLLRIFNLFLLESILEIREDIQEAPASVTEDVMFTQDVLTVPERLGLQFVCGGEVIEICDKEGGLVNHFTGGTEKDEHKAPKDGNEISNPEPPSRLKFQKALKSSTHALPANTKSAKDEQNDVHIVDAATDLDFSRQGRVNAMLVRQLELSLQLPEDVGYTCKTAGYFWLLHVYSWWEQFLAACAQNQDNPLFDKEWFHLVSSSQHSSTSLLRPIF